ncbi:hypothetical protein [Bradyrhizobium elkanii]|uniref:hypothetical protein n=1 Tax=Bradyrhizobium elkanii TaxID=29448 RepID=UPI00056E5B8A|nr:hypothetical protein [Bradyrhizobium elkanii]
MKAPVGSPAESAGELYFKTDVSPEQIFQAIGRLRREARDEIDRLIRFLDDTDDHMEREPDDDEPSLGFQETFPGRGAPHGGSGDDREPDLGSFDRMMNQEHCNRQRFGEEIPEVDAEQDDADNEPSLGGIDHGHNQERWSTGGRRDLELDPAESGIGDRDGLLEQVGTEDWRQGGHGMKTMTRRLGLQIIAGAAAAPAAATTVPLANPDAELIELGRQFVEVSRLRDAASEETRRLVDIGADDTAAEEAFEEAMDQLRAIFPRMIGMRPRTIEGMRAIASAVLHFEWDGNNVEYAEGCVEGAALAVLVAGLLNKPLPKLPDWAAAWI